MFSLNKANYTADNNDVPKLFDFVGLIGFSCFWVSWMRKLI